MCERRRVDEGRGSLLARAQDYFGHYQHNYVYATDQFIAAHPETVRNYFLATRESLEYARANLDELVDFAASQVKLKKPLIRAYYESQIIQWDLSFNVDLEGAANAVKILQEFKDIKPDVTFDPKAWFDLRFLE